MLLKPILLKNMENQLDVELKEILSSLDGLLNDVNVIHKSFFGREYIKLYVRRGMNYQKTLPKSIIDYLKKTYSDIKSVDVKEYNMYECSRFYLHLTIWI